MMIAWPLRASYSQVASKYSIKNIINNKVLILIDHRILIRIFKPDIASIQATKIY